MHYIDWRRLRDLSTEALEKVGMLPEDAAVTTETLVEADLRGVDTHGAVNLLVPDVKMLAEGNMNPRPNLMLVKDTANSVLIDADDGMGNLVAVKATRISIEKAKKYGVMIVGVKNSTHCGAMAYYPMLAIEHDMIAIVTANSAPVAPAYGGVTKVLSTNPYAVAVPAGKELPVVIDISSTASAQSKILYYARLGKKIPLGWGLNSYGEPTEDPTEVLNGGFLAWAGGHKGYAWSLLCNILAGVLTGSPFGQYDFPPYQTATHGQTKVTEGFFILIFRIDCFMLVTEFKNRMDEMIRQIKASKPARGFTNVYLPGELEFLEKQRRLKTGIPVDDLHWKELQKLKQELGLKTILK